MARQMAAKWREAASLIIVGKDKMIQKGNCDYKVLLFNRTEKASFMPSSSVFPGGVCEQIDGSPLWLEHFQRFGISAEKLKALSCVKGSRPGIFKKSSDDCLQKEISLRLTAVRETFEEMGILLCRHRSTSDMKNGFSFNFEHIGNVSDKEHWQNVVHNDATKFLTLCRELDVVPDLWNLHEWSAWLTPAHFPKRFETAFYLIGLPEIPEVLLEKNEVTSYAWKTPSDFLKSFFNKEIWLPTPQFYELSRLLNFPRMDELLTFAENRAKNGITLINPVVRKCKDGMVALMPGDDLYPADPNESSKLKSIENSIAEYRSGVSKLHRTELPSTYEAIVHLNFPLDDGQVAPVTTTK